MKLSRLLSLGLIFGIFSVLGAEARIERQLTETFDVRPGGLAELSIQGGNIDVSTGDTDQAIVEARLVFARADSEAEADEILAKLELTMEPTGEGIAVTSRRSPQNSRWFGWGRSQAVTLHLSVVVPADFQIDARTSGGNIRIADLRGEVRARTSGGNIALGRIDGPVDVSTSGGDIKIDHARGPVKAHTAGGDVRIDGAEGPVNASTSGGDVHIGRVEGELKASTSGGDISARLVGPRKADASLSTSGGDVTVWVEEASAFTLDARTSGGRVQAAGLTIRIMDGGSGKNELQGEVNGGGPVLKLRSSGGDVHVKTT